MVYLPGILCKKNKTLINVAFSSKTTLRQILYYAPCPASHSSSSLFYILWFDVQRATLTWYPVLAALIATAIQHQINEFHITDVT